MANLTKVIESGLVERYQVFNSTDLNDVGGALAQGDVVRVENSLKRPAKRIVIETNGLCDLGVTINSRQMVYPRADSLATLRPMGAAGIEGSIKILAQGAETTTNNAELSIGPAAVWSFEGIVSDIEITTWTAGTWEIRCY